MVVPASCGTTSTLAQCCPRAHTEMLLADRRESLQGIHVAWKQTFREGFAMSTQADGHGWTRLLS